MTGYTVGAVAEIKTSAPGSFSPKQRTFESAAGVGEEGGGRCGPPCFTTRNAPVIEDLPYAEVDAVIAKWVSALNSTLNTEWADEPARFFYTHGDPPFECFQISVRPPSAGQIAVDAYGVDTNDDTEDELVASWVGQVTELDAMLAKAVDTIEEWKRRERRRPDPPSPW